MIPRQRGLYAMYQILQTRRTLKKKWIVGNSGSVDLELVLATESAQFQLYISNETMILVDERKFLANTYL